MIKQSINQSIRNQSFKKTKNTTIHEWRLEMLFRLLEEWKLLPWLLLELLSSYKSVIQRRGKVCFLNLPTKQISLKQKKVFNLHSFPTLPQNHDSKASVNSIFLMYFLGDQLLQNLMKDSISSWKDCARFWWP